MTKLDKKTRFLIADDKPNMLRTVSNMLRMLGYENVIKAEDGEKALTLLHSEKVDMVLSDWNMPKMTGVDLLRAVREDDNLKPLPFLMITGEVDMNTVAEAGETDVDGYLLKPFTSDDLKSKIEEILNKKKEPSPIDVHIAVSDVYLQAKQYELAIEELKKALKISSKSPKVAYALGRVYEAQDQLDKAENFFKRAVEFGRQYLKGHEALARVYRNTDRLEEAMEELKKAVRISPKNVDRQLNLSHLLVKTGKKDEAKKILRNVMLLAEKNRADVTLQVGEQFLEAGLAEEAQKVFMRALDDDPKAIHIYNRLAIALRRQKKFGEAVTTYRKAISMDSENEALYYNLGRAYYEAGDKEKATAAMKRALKIFPDFEEAKTFLSKFGVG